MRENLRIAREALRAMRQAGFRRTWWAIRATRYESLEDYYYWKFKKFNHKKNEAGKRAGPPAVSNENPSS